MKKNRVRHNFRSLLCSLFIIALFVGPALQADEVTEHHDGPCIKIMEACKNAGFGAKSSAADKKSLSKNCIQPLLAGQKVSGVSVDVADINACKAKKAELKK
jgi:hypothetical protein